jgi:hypothetical protein
LNIIVTSGHPKGRQASLATLQPLASQRGIFDARPDSNVHRCKKVVYKSILKFFILDILKMSIFDFLGGLFQGLFQKVDCEHNAVKLKIIIFA